jgi:hypothetical protein
MGGIGIDLYDVFAKQLEVEMPQPKQRRLESHKLY